MASVLTLVKVSTEAELWWRVGQTQLRQDSQSHAAQHGNHVSRFTSAQMCILVVWNNSKSIGCGVTGRVGAHSCSAWDFPIPLGVRNTSARTQPLREHTAPEMTYFLLPEQNAGSSLLPHKSLRHQSPHDTAKQSSLQRFHFPSLCSHE